MSKIIVIVGITGFQGSSVAHTFLRLPEWRIRGITRNPSSPAAQAFAANGVEIVKADLDDRQSLFPAFAGAAVIFSNTDFFAPFFTALASQDLPQGRTPNEHAFDREVAQGINIAEAAASLGVLKSLEHFVFSSLSDARKWSGGKYTGVYHFESKAEVERVIRARFPELAKRMSTVQIGHYVTNWKTVASMAPQKQPDGSFLMLRPVTPEDEIPFVVAHRDTGAFVEALIDIPPGKHLLGVSQAMTWPEWMKLWGDVLGVKAGFKQIPRDDFLSDVPDQVKKEISEGDAYVMEFGYTGGDPEVLTVEQLDFKVPLTSVEDYIKSEDWSSVL